MAKNSELSDLLKRADATLNAVLPKPPVPTPKRQETPKEKRDRLMPKTGRDQLAKVIKDNVAAKRQEVKANYAKREQEMAELAEYRAERAEFLQLFRRWQLGGMTKAQYARLQELRPRHEGAEK